MSGRTGVRDTSATKVDRVPRLYAVREAQACPEGPCLGVRDRAAAYEPCRHHHAMRRDDHRVADAVPNKINNTSIEPRRGVLLALPTGVSSTLYVGASSLLNVAVPRLTNSVNLVEPLVANHPVYLPA